MLLVSSNPYKDREGEIVSQRALEQYAQNYRGDNKLLFWHRGDPIGVILEAEMAGPFLVEVAEELDDQWINMADYGEDDYVVRVSEVWDAIENSDVEWGASIGFLHRSSDKEDNVYDNMIKVETSVLPVDAAANGITYSKIINNEETTNGTIQAQ